MPVKRPGGGDLDGEREGTRSSALDLRECGDHLHTAAPEAPYNRLSDATPPPPPPSPPPSPLSKLAPAVASVVAARSDAAIACVAAVATVAAAPSDAQLPQLPPIATAPAFFLEKQVRISVYQLYLPLPAHLSPSADSPILGASLSVPSSSVSGNSSNSEDGPMRDRGALLSLSLPVNWRPGIRFISVGHGPPSGVVVEYDLPCIPTDLVSHALGSMGKTAALADFVLRLPRASFRLTLQLNQQIDVEKVHAALFRDHIAIRLPMFYGGSALPDRPTSCVTREEILAFRGGELACRTCGAALLLQHAPNVSGGGGGGVAAMEGSAITTSSTTTSGASSTDVECSPPSSVSAGVVIAGSSSAATADIGIESHISSSSSNSSSSTVNATAHGLHALVLPSEYWLEWSDFWLCHGDEKNVFIPERDFGGRAGTVLVGETHIQLHPSDVDVRTAVRCVLDAALQAGVIGEETTTAEVPAVVAPHSSGLIDGIITPEASQYRVECCRCGSVLGHTTIADPDRCLEYSEASASLARRLVIPPTGWAKELSVEEGPVLRLNKDALFLPAPRDALPTTTPALNDAGSSLATATTVETPAARGPSIGRTAATGADTSVTATLIGGAQSNALAHYTICSRLANVLIASAHAHQQYRYEFRSSSGARGSTLLSVVIVNWSSSVRSSRGPSASTDAEAPHPSKGLLVPAPDFGALGAVLACERDVPALKVRYKLVGGDDEAVVARRATDTSGSMVLTILDSELEAVCATLLASTLLLPPSCRELGGMSVGFFPLM